MNSNCRKKIVRKVAAEVVKEKGKKISYMVGTMIEFPRAALLPMK